MYVEKLNGYFLSKILVLKPLKRFYNLSNILKKRGKRREKETHCERERERERATHNITRKYYKKRLPSILSHMQKWTTYRDTV